MAVSSEEIASYLQGAVSTGYGIQEDI